MARSTRALAVAVLAGLLAGCGHDPAAPASDACDAPTAGGVDAVEIGAASAADLAGRPTPFSPLAEGDGVPLIRGPQGANMIGLALRISGGAAPTCLLQRTVVVDGSGARLVAATPPLRTYLQPDGTRRTHPLWLPADYPMQFTVNVDAADKAISRHLHLLLAP